jgi:hypothetical protein
MRTIESTYRIGQWFPRLGRSRACSRIKGLTSSQERWIQGRYRGVVGVWVTFGNRTVVRSKRLAERSVRDLLGPRRRVQEN